MAQDLAARPRLDRHPIAIGVAGRPHPGEAVSGDAHAVQWWDGTCRIAVIDGLGHGAAAAAAAARAVESLAAHPQLDPVESLRRCHAALAGTRGAAISVVRIDPAGRELVYAGVGNVEAHLWQGGRHERLIVYRGIVGSVMRTIRPFAVRLIGPWTLLLHTDGISARADVTALAQGRPWEPTALALAIVERFGRSQDDALAAVAMPAAPSGGAAG